ncbi:hypothetical protein NDU88_003362 [Pleurodeles waltl]|uniref:Uncharacterized protein n=1 Tax=Pleurodeles waltl TaxID=8319 RepID=A0AAV7T5C4_PLEWA|nr:hypothetical protein NDU88_003362 [Pleurodeles waltl]
MQSRVYTVLAQPYAGCSGPVAAILVGVAAWPVPKRAPGVLGQQTHWVGGSGEALAMPATVEEPSRAELLAAIQGARVALEGKIEMVAVEVNFLQADLSKFSEKAKVAEGSIVDLQTEVGNLR